MRSSIDGLIETQSIENYNFQISKSEIRPKLIYLFKVSFLTTLDIYKTYFKSFPHGYRDQEFVFLCEKLLYLYVIGFCNQVLHDLHYWWSEELCSQQHPFMLVELVMYWNPFKRISQKLEICASRERRLLQDQVQLGIRARVQL